MAEAREVVDAALLRANQIEFLKEHWFNLVGKERDSRNTFDGIMTRETYTKAASLAALKATLPVGKITLVGEQESKMARVVPHILRKEILADRFERAVIGFNKDATIDILETRQAAFKESIEASKHRSIEAAKHRSMEGSTSRYDRLGGSPQLDRSQSQPCV